MARPALRYSHMGVESHALDCAAIGETERQQSVIAGRTPEATHR